MTDHTMPTEDEIVAAWHTIHRLQRISMKPMLTPQERRDRIQSGWPEEPWEMLVFGKLGIEHALSYLDNALRTRVAIRTYLDD